MTLLLVSPKNLTEALTAYEGGADIIDVKNPEEGSLGANFPWVISEIRESIPSEVPVSAAIGDLPNLPGTASLAALGVIKSGADIVKVGIKGPEEKGEAVDLMMGVVKSVEEGASEVVVCGYGDHVRSETIDPMLIPDIASESGADIAMLDTAVKDGESLISFLDYGELEEFIQKCHSMGIRAALAGSLGFDEVKNLSELSPDIVGVRGAVCRDGDRREGIISEEPVRELKSLLEA